MVRVVSRVMVGLIRPVTQRMLTLLVRLGLGKLAQVLGSLPSRPHGDPSYQQQQLRGSRNATNLVYLSELTVVTTIYTCLYLTYEFVHVPPSTWMLRFLPKDLNRASVIRLSTIHDS